VGLLLFASKALGLWKAVVTFTVGGVIVRFPLAAMGLFGGAACLGMALWMIWTSKVGKLQEREKLLNRIPWRGDEQVLDVGCGRGLMLVGAAKRLSSGRAMGVDIWQAEDLSGNRPESTLENARREGRRGARGSRDRGYARTAVPGRNLRRGRLERRDPQPLRERRPGESHPGDRPRSQTRRTCSDRRHPSRQYALAFAAAGCRGAESAGSVLGALLLGLLTMGSLRPCTILARK
jgi:hypothetical protein